jgi:hypothetical protein
MKKNTPYRNALAKFIKHERSINVKVTDDAIYAFFAGWFARENELIKAVLPGSTENKCGEITLF